MPSNEQDISRYLRYLAHEIKGPLAAIRASVAMMSRFHDEETKQQHLQRIDAWSHQIETVVHTVTAMSDGFAIVVPEPCDLREDIFLPVIARVTPLLGNLRLPRSHITVSGFDQLPRLTIDKNAFQHAAFHLLSNSVKYATTDPDNFRLEISAERRRNGFVIKIKDWGIGIDPKDREKLTTPFFRSRRAEVASVHGIGLGLYMATSVVKNHGGRLQVTGLEKPTVIEIVLPLSLAKHAPRSRRE